MTTLNLKLNLKQGESVDKLIYKIQKQSTLYFYSLDGDLHWSDTLFGVANQIQAYGHMDDLHDKSGWFGMCHAYWNGRPNMLVELKIYSKELLDYLNKNLVVHDYTIEEETMKKQAKDLNTVFLVVYQRNKTGFDNANVIKSKLSDEFFEKLKIKKVSIFDKSGYLTDIEGSYENKEAMMVITHPEMTVSILEGKLDKNTK